jgi:murein DD-endopeptidase MepM/ murein hydrolase activator NlpD
MHITRVALSFFSVGFLAGTFEQAAGLGNAQHGHRTSTLVAEASTTFPARPVEAVAAQPSHASPIRPGGPAQLLPGPEQSSGRFPLPLEAGDGSVAEAVAAFAAGPHARATAAETASGAAAPAVPAAVLASQRPTSLPEETAPLPLARRAFVSLPHLEGAMGVPDERPGAFRIPPPTRVHEFIMPIDKGRVTSMFHQGRFHPAIDLAAPLGTPVRATTRKQKVTFAGRRGGYGNLVITRDPSGRQHYYGHLHRIVAGIGTLLDQGDLLGLLGSTGHSTGPHVHYEVRKRSGGHFNPATLLFPGLSVRPGYAWNDASSPMLAAVRSPTKAAARTGVRRSVHATRKVKRRTVAKVARRARFAARAPTVRYYATTRATRSGTRLAARYGQPRPR